MVAASCTITFLVTKFISSALAKNQINERVVESEKKIHLQEESLARFVVLEREAAISAAVKSHQVECETPSNIKRVERNINAIRLAMVFLVTKEGGHPKDYGLFEKD